MEEQDGLKAAGTPIMRPVLFWSSCARETLLPGEFSIRDMSGSVSPVRSVAERGETWKLRVACDSWRILGAEGSRRREANIVGMPRGYQVLMWNGILRASGSAAVICALTWVPEIAMWRARFRNNSARTAGLVNVLCFATGRVCIPIYHVPFCSRPSRQAKSTLRTVDVRFMKASRGST